MRGPLFLTLTGEGYTKAPLHTTIRLTHMPFGAYSTTSQLILEFLVHSVEGDDLSKVT